MDTKKISALLTAIDRGSLTAAASELGYTQSGLTRMMNALEDETGIKLLIRTKKGVRLSPAGTRLLSGMRRLSMAADDLEFQINQIRSETSSKLRLGAYSSVARQWIPAMFEEFKKVCPNTEVTLSVGGILDIYESVREDKLDCAIVSYHEELCHGLRWIHLMDDELLAVLPPDSETGRDSFPVKNFDGREFMMPSDGFDLDVNPVLYGAGKRIEPRIRYTGLSDESIVSMVAHGLGTSIMSELVMKGIGEDVITARLEPSASRNLGIIKREHDQDDRNIRRFIRTALTVIERMYGNAEK